MNTALGTYVTRTKKFPKSKDKKIDNDKKRSIY